MKKKIVEIQLSKGNIHCFAYDIMVVFFNVNTWRYHYLDLRNHMEGVTKA